MAERASQTDQEEADKLEQDKDDDQHRNSVDSVEDQQPQPQPEEQSQCPGCQSLGVMTLPCGHKLCPRCIELSRGELGQDGCTICYGSQLMDSILNTLLEALFHDQPRRPGVTPGAAEERGRAEKDGGEAVSGYWGVEKEELCNEHEEMLSVFCLEEGKLLCQQCQTDEHEEHQCCSIQEAALSCKVSHNKLH